MTVSKAALLPDHVGDAPRHEQQQQQRRQNSNSTSTSTDVGIDKNPMTVQFGRHHDSYSITHHQPSSSVSMAMMLSKSQSQTIELSDTMYISEHGTMLIFDNNDAHNLYTEIPFLAVHGMQTRQPRLRSTYGDAYTDSFFLGADYNPEDDEERPAATKPAAATPVAAATRDNDDGGLLSVLSTTSDGYNSSCTSTLTLPLMIATICNSLSQFLVGYNLVVLNSLEPYIFPGHSTLSWSWTVSAIAIGAPIGAMIGGRLSDQYGRKLVLQFNSFGFLIAGTMQAFSPTLRFMTFSRFLLGLQSGIATVLVPLYLGELAPARIRGTLGTINQFALVVGILASSLLSFPFANMDGWRFLLSITPIVAAVQLCTSMFLVESPRYLLHRNPNDQNAKEVLKYLRGKDNVDKELRTYKLADAAYAAAATATTATATKENTNDVMPQSTANSNRPVSNNWDLLTKPKLRFTFFCCLGLHIAQQLCGVSCVFYYSTSLFDELGFRRPLIGTTSIGTVNVMFTYFALLLMDTCKSKSLVLWSIGGMLVSCIGMIASHNFVLWPETNVISSSTNDALDDFSADNDYDDYYSYPEDYQNPNSLLALVSVNAYVAFYAVGLGPIPFLWIAEMVNPSYVALVMSVCSQLNWVINFIVGLVFPLMKEVLDGWVFVPFAAVLCISFLFVWKVLPAKEDYGM